MIKKLLISGFLLISCTPLLAQTPNVPNCGLSSPPLQWEEWMQEKMQESKSVGTTSNKIVKHVIPVIVHIVSYGEPINTYPNVDSNQIKSQIVVLNNDFAGLGAYNGTLPAVFANLKANTGIEFCLAKKDPQDNGLNPAGIHRVNAQANSWLSPATANLDVKDYFNTVIIPGTIWDPNKYLNIWISDKPNTYPLNGFATYPPSANLNGLFNGQFGNINNDGIWVYTRAFGTIGVNAPYDGGRTATHEIGHWLGLRHLWGDGNCLSDYVGDTPGQKQPNYGCPTYPTTPDRCGVNTAPNGDMFMNFMDRTDDGCMAMFTHEQSFRMQTALSQSPLRYALGTHDKCDGAPTTTAPALAVFNLNPAQCSSQPFTPSNNSSGYPTPTFLWSSSPPANFLPNSSVANPGISVTNPGNYTISLVATNSLSSSTASMVINVIGPCQQLSACIDSIKIIKSVDTLKTYKLPNSTANLACQTGFAGYLAGTNCYRDKEFAQFYSPNTYTSVPQPQVNSVIVLFDTLGTFASNPATQVVCKLYGGNPSTGPGGLINSKSDSIGRIVQTPKVTSITYLGKSGLQPLSGTKIFPYKFDFQSPVVINSISGFYASVTTPTTLSGDSINIFTNTIYNSAVDSSAWLKQFTDTWRRMKTERSKKVQLAIIPQITCSPAVGLKEILSDLQSGMMVMPNPGTGLFHMVFTLKQEQDLRIRIFNVMGEVISDAQVSDVKNYVLNLDLSSEPNGIYFAEVSGAQEKAVKKIVLSR